MNFTYFSSHFNNLKLRQKVFCLYTLVGICTLILSLVLLTALIGRRSRTSELRILTDSLNQTISQVEAEVERYNSLSEYLFNDTHMLTAVNGTYKKDYFKMYLALSDTIEPSLRMYQLLNPTAEHITIYTDCGLPTYKKYTAPLAAMEFTPETFDNFSNFWLTDSGPDGRRLFSIRKMMQNTIYRKNNYLCIQINYDQFFEPFSSLIEKDCGLLITNVNRQVMASMDSFVSPESRIPSAELAENYEVLKKNLKNDYMFLKTDITGTDWTVHYYKTTAASKQSAVITISTMFFLIAGCILLLFWGTYRITDTVIGPVEDLTRSMQRLKLDEPDILPHTERTDEIGILINSFNHMIGRIRTLIQQVYITRLGAQDYQLRALRAQINPHFLYNVLSLINGKAIVSGQSNISRMTLLLSQFYRTSLNHGRDMTTIKNEIENVRTYIEIQQIMNDRDFEVLFDLDETLELCQMPNLILQPIVENAIDHGLRCTHKKQKLLTIRLYRYQNDIQFLIKDNGNGMPKEMMHQLFSRDSNGVGIKNVDERLKLSYGEEYGLKIFSSTGEGTEILITIKNRLANQ